MTTTAPLPRLYAGLYFRRAVTLPVHDVPQRRALLLIAACLDTGYSPSVTDLAARLRTNRVTVVRLLDELEAAGHLHVERANGERNRYALPEAESR